MVLFAPAMSVGLIHASINKLDVAKFENVAEMEGGKFKNEFDELTPGRFRACVILPVPVLDVILAALPK
jgi:hypothetical protein